MHFLEMNYVRIGDWMDKTVECFGKIRSINKDNDIKDIEIELSEGQKARITEVRSEFLQSEIKDLFYSTLGKLELALDYKRYIDSKQGGAENE